MTTLNFFRNPYMALLAVLFLFPSCKKEIFQEPSTSLAKEASSYDKTSRILTDTEISEIGINHNNYLSELLTKPNGDTVYTTSQLKDNAILKFPQLASYQDASDLIIDESDSLGIQDFYILVDNNASSFNNPQLLKNFVYQASLLIDQYSDYNTFVNALEIINSNAKNSLIGVDLDTYLVFSAVYKSSVGFWINDDNLNYFAAAGVSGSDVAKADGISAAIGFFTLAAVTSGLVIAAGSGGLATPAVVIVMELLGIGFSSALSSGAVILGL